MLGLDLALVNTGIVVLTEAGLVLRRTTLRYPLLQRKTQRSMVAEVSEDHRVQRLLSIANDIVGIVKQFSVQRVAIEGPALGTKRQAHQHQTGEVSGVVKTQLWLATHIIPVVIPVPTVRKHFLGYGKATKEDVQAVLPQVGIEFDTDHEADAYLVARCLYDDLTKERTR